MSCQCGYRAVNEAITAVLLRALQEIHTLIGNCEPQPEHGELDEEIAKCQDAAFIEVFSIIENLLGEDAEKLVDIGAPGKLLATLQNYETALAWYANETNWEELGRDESAGPPALNDYGNKARDALGGKA